MLGYHHLIPATLLVLLLALAGCGGKEDKQSAPHPPGTPPPVQTPPTAPAAERTKRFRIRDVDGRETVVEFIDHEARFHRIRQPLVMIVLFADWCPPCRGMLPYLGQLQAANKDRLFVIGVLVHSELDTQGLRRLMLRYESNFFISQSSDNDALGDYLAALAGQGADYPLPLTLVFKNGKYVMNVQGAAPYEMLQNLVDQLSDTTKKEE